MDALRTTSIESVTVDGKFVRSSQDGSLVVTGAGQLSTTNLKHIKHVRAGTSRDISATTAGSNTFLRELCLEYTNGEISTTIVIPETILEYRSTTGVVKTYSRGGRSWEGTYMGTYCSVGMPIEVYNFLRECFDAHGNVDLVQGISVVGKHAWVRAKLLQGDDRLRLIYRREGKLIEEADPAEFMARLKHNVTGTASFSMRLKRSNVNRAKAKAMPWTLSLTMHAFQLHELSNASGPKLNRGPRTFVDDQAIGDALASKLADLALDEDLERVYDEVEEEGGEEGDSEDGGSDGGGEASDAEGTILGKGGTQASVGSASSRRSASRPPSTSSPHRKRVASQQSNNGASTATPSPRTPIKAH